MATNAAGRRYGTWYAMMLQRLYPRPFRERSVAGRGLFGLALWIFFETSVGITMENTTHRSKLGKTMLRVALGALAVWMVPVRGLAASAN